MPRVITNGANPTLLLDSGTHGDEAEIIPLIEDALDMYRNKLPPYMYIREVSPSAVRLRTRKNEEGHDINRVFRDDSQSREVQSLIRTLRPYRFSLGVSFHMDLGNDAFYFYDSGDFSGNSILEKFQSDLEQLSIPLLSGVDDKHDPILGDPYTRGYPTHPPSKTHTGDGTMWSWFLTHDKVKRLFMAEIPGRLVTNLKKELVKIFFSTLIIPLASARL